MRKTLIVLIVTFSSLYSADAQWYYKSCGVTDINNCTSQEFECLWERAAENVRKGSTTTLIGVVGLMLGYVWNEMGDGLIGYSIGPMTVLYGGIITTCIGSIWWIIGADRQAVLRKNPLYETFSSGSLNLSPTINRNHFGNSYSVGLTASLRF